MADKRTESHWYALYTRPRVEKRVASILEEKEIRAFLPTRSVMRQWSDRKKVAEEPLFPSYVFVFADLAERYRSLQSTGVVRMVQFNGKPARIPDEQIETIYRILNGGYYPEPHQYLREGDEVEIVAGPLTGIKGYFLEGRGNKRLIISVHTLQQSFAIELRRGQIKSRALQNILVRNTAPHIN